MRKKVGRRKGGGGGGMWQALSPLPGTHSLDSRGESSNTWPLVTLEATPRSQLVRTLVHLMRPTMNTRTLGKL